MNIKTTIHLFIFLSVILSCKAQNKSDNINNMYPPFFSPLFEKFDFKHYENLKKENPIKETNYAMEILLDTSMMLYNLTDDSIPATTQYFKMSFFRICKIYYPNGNIKEKGIGVDTGKQIKVGTWYHFDESGKVHKEDNDKGYKFSINDVISYCKKKNIPYIHGIPYGGDKGRFDRFFIEKGDTMNGDKIWIIDFADSVDHSLKLIYLHGMTGKVLPSDTPLKNNTIK